MSAFVSVFFIPLRNLFFYFPPFFLFLKLQVLEAFFVVASTEKIRQTEALVEIERDCEALIIKSAQSTRDMLEKSVVAEKQTYLRTSLERKNAQLNMKKNELGIQLRNLESEWSVKENDANFERNRILQKKKEAADKIIENKRIENDLEEIREMESNIRRREREVEMMEIERNRLVQLENIEREKLREDEISEILKRADDISTKNSNTNTNTTTPPNTFPGKQKSSNPFSRKEKYVYKKKEEVVVDINKKVETLELKKKEEYMFKRSNNDYLNLENFYTI